MKQKAQNLYDAAFGCLLGACVGDAAGARLELIGRKPTFDEVQHAMTMPGGGVWNVAPGQITDDGELTLCLAQALCGNAQFPLEQIARNYASWMQSGPFDRGITTTHAFNSVCTPHWQSTYETESYAEAMHKAAEFWSLDSKANGSLMRATPSGIWGYQLEDRVLAKYANRTHCSPTPTKAVVRP
jgi:ADP-ribosylglycohydrolase